MDGEEVWVDGGALRDVVDIRNDDCEKLYEKVRIEGNLAASHQGVFESRIASVDYG